MAAAADLQSVFSEPSQELWQALGWTPSPGQLVQLEMLQVQLRQWNSRRNLTRLVEGEDFWIAQVFDSLWPLLPMISRVAAAGSGESLRIIDVGTGGGFPGLAAAIAFPGARLTLVDSVARKVEAVRAMAEAIGLAERISLRCERIEQTGHQRDCRAGFDVALARAVAQAPVVAEYLVPLLRPAGRALLYRGIWTDADSAGLERALRPLRARLVGVHSRQLPAARGLRHVLEIEPTDRCPSGFPRPVGVPAKQPLGHHPG